MGKDEEKEEGGEKKEEDSVDGLRDEEEIALEWPIIISNTFFGFVALEVESNDKSRESLTLEG